MAVLLGDTVNYKPTLEMGVDPVAALVIGVHEEAETVDLKCFMGYTLGITDVKDVKEGDKDTPGTYFTPEAPEPPAG